jgi:hypothetical protein
MKVYKDTEVSGKMFYRLFDENIDENKLIWHRDHEDRKVHVICGSGWKLQMDDELPIDLIPGCDYIIPKMTFHRIFKGEKSLILRIEEQ